MHLKPNLGIVALAAVLLLGGCGKAEQKTGKAADKQIIVTSAVDCADNTDFDYDTCYTILLKAVDLHGKTSQSFNSLKACEKSEGAGRCERIAQKLFRPRLMAFQVTLSRPPVAVPLYVSKSTPRAFRTASNTDVPVENETYTFTKSATDAVDLFKTKKQSKSAF